MSLSHLARRVGKYASDHSPVILTAIGVAGTLTTAYLTGQAAVKASRIIDDLDRPDTRDKIDATWKLFIPSAASACTTIACIVMANRIGDRRTAALAAAYAVSERVYTEYKEKVIEKVGANKERAYRDEISQERVTTNPPSSQVMMPGDGSVICFDDFTGRYFLSSMEELKSAQNAVNYNVLNDFYASLSDFYDLVNLPRTGVSDEFGWNSDKLLDLEFSSSISERGIPVLVVKFSVGPIRGYSRIN